MLSGKRRKTNKDYVTFDTLVIFLIYFIIVFVVIAVMNVDDMI